MPFSLSYLDLECLRFKVLNLSSTSSQLRTVFIFARCFNGNNHVLKRMACYSPNQKVLIANAENVLKGGAANPDAAKHAGKALLASRTNTLFSIPLLFFMGASRHLGLGMGLDVSPYPAVGVITAIILAIEVNAIKGKLGPLTTVKGVIHCGLGLLVVLYGLLEVMV